MATDDPIDQRWISNYVEQLLEISSRQPDSPTGIRATDRAEAVLDMQQAWRERNQKDKPWK